VDEEQAESSQQLIARSQQTLDRIRQHQGQGIVFSHSLFMKTLLWIMLAQPTRINKLVMQRFWGFWRSFRVLNAAILKVDILAN